MADRRGEARFQVRNVSTIDTDTGEVLDAVPVMFVGKQRWAEESVIVFQQAAEALAINRELGDEARRVALYLIGHLSYENWVHVRQTAVADALGMKQPSVARALKRLVEHHVLVQGKVKLGRSYPYRLNSHVGWRGRVRSLEKHRTSAEGRTEKPLMKVIPGGKAEAEGRVEDGRQPELSIVGRKPRAKGPRLV
jgi:DNA-binding transcriptional ArsR family regulator